MGYVYENEIIHRLKFITINNHQGPVIVKMNQEDGSGPNDYNEIYTDKDGIVCCSHRHANNESECYDEVHGPSGVYFRYSSGDELKDFVLEDNGLADMWVLSRQLSIDTVDAERTIFDTKIEFVDDAYGRYNGARQVSFSKAYYDIQTGKRVTKEEFMKKLDEMYPDKNIIIDELGISVYDLIDIVSTDIGLEYFLSGGVITEDELYRSNEVDILFDRDGNPYNKDGITPKHYSVDTTTGTDYVDSLDGVEISEAQKGVTVYPSDIAKMMIEQDKLAGEAEEQEQDDIVQG